MLPQLAIKAAYELAHIGAVVVASLGAAWGYVGLAVMSIPEVLAGYAASVHMSRTYLYV
ncbi:MAG: hypothetical protein ACYCZR_07460 [Burkholderiales bacterium]